MESSAMIRECCSRPAGLSTGVQFPAMTEQKCLRCGGPVTKDVEPDSWYCTACMMSFTLTEGRFTASITSPVRNGVHWTDEPWFVKVRERLDVHNAKKD